LSLLIGASVLLGGRQGGRIVMAESSAGDRAPVLGPAAMMIVPGVYLLGGLAPSAAYAVDTPGGIVLVDSGLRADAGPLKTQMAELKLDWKRVRAILLTHAHGDHTGGAEHLRAATGAKVYAGAGDAGVLRAGGPREAFFSTFSMPDETTHPTTVDVALEGGETIDLGGVRFRALAMPGHTPGSTCYLMERDGLRVLFTGDVIHMLLGDPESHSRVRAPLGTYSAYLAPRYRGDAVAYLATLRRLRALEVPDLVLPGHPRSDPSPQSPRLSKARWDALLDRGIKEMEILVARREADGADFLDGEPKTLLPGLYYLGDRQGRAVYGLSASSKLFLVDAPGGPGLLEFVRGQLRRLGLEPVDPAAVLLTSGGEPETAGLKELVEQCHVTVFAPPAALPRLRQICAPGTALVPADELPSRGWFKVDVVPLRAGDLGPIAYRVEWAGKSVLLSGRIPTKSQTEGWPDPSSAATASRGLVLDALISLYKLADAKPDLWLPATPVDGQNANLYDHDWADIITTNYQAGNSMLSRIR
jgi:glyoxylase-like metal-dependent hydrolase (beta-lactamase superfamily II)